MCVCVHHAASRMRKTSSASMCLASAALWRTHSGGTTTSRASAPQTQVTSVLRSPMRAGGTISASTPTSMESTTRYHDESGAQTHTNNHKNMPTHIHTYSIQSRVHTCTHICTITTTTKSSTCVFQTTLENQQNTVNYADSPCAGSGEVTVMCVCRHQGGRYLSKSKNLLGPDGVVWYTWKDSDYYSMRKVTMMIRPRTFRPRLSP